MSIPCPMTRIEPPSRFSDCDRPIVKVHGNGSTPPTLHLTPDLEPLDDCLLPFARRTYRHFQVPYHVPDHSEEFGTNGGLSFKEAVVACVSEDHRRETLLGGDS